MGIAGWALALGVVNAAFSAYIYWRTIRTKLVVTIGMGHYGPSHHRREGVIIEGVNHGGRDIVIKDVRILWDGRDLRIPVEMRPQYDRLIPEGLYQVTIGAMDLKRSGISLPADVQAVLVTSRNKRFTSPLTHLE